MELPQKMDDSSNHTPIISLIWLDESNQTGDDNTFVQQQLRIFDPNLKLFQNDIECENYIKSQSDDQSFIVLIVNGKLGQKIISRVENLSQIIAIYIFCFDKEFHQQWTKDISKVKGVVNHFDDLKYQIQINHFNNNNNNNQHENEGIYELNNQYIFSDICIDYLSQMETIENEKNAFILLYRTVFEGNTERMAIIQIFQESYSPDGALTWLRRDPFFTQILETSFQQADTKTMYLCQFLIRDIKNQFEQNKCTSSILVYRGELMSNENLEQMKNFKGKIIAMKTFLSTTLNRDIALMFISEQNEQKRVLFEIEANPEIEGVKPFIKTGPIFNEIDSDEVIFMLGSLFKINEIHDDENGITIIKMTLCASEYENSIKTQLNIIPDQTKNLIEFAQLQYNLSQLLDYPNILNNLDIFVQKHLSELSDDHFDFIRCYDLLGMITFAKSDWDICLSWWQQSLEMKKKILPLNDPKLILCYEYIACIYFNKKENVQALEAYKQNLNIYKQIHGDDHLNLIPTYMHIIEIYELEGQFKDVLLCYNQIYSIMLKHFPVDDMNLAPIYNNMGKTFVSLFQYPLALGYYQTSLNIKLKNLTTSSDSVALTYKSIGFVYKYMENIDQARIYFQKAAEIYRELHSSTDDIVLEIEQLIDNLSSSS